MFIDLLLNYPGNEGFSCPEQAPSYPQKSGDIGVYRETRVDSFRFSAEHKTHRYGEPQQAEDQFLLILHPRFVAAV